MADRKRSNDGTRETDEFLDGEMEAPDHGGRAGGGLERKVGTRDEKRSHKFGEDSTTRVMKSDEKGEGNLGGLHGKGEDD